MKVIGTILLAAFLLVAGAVLLGGCSDRTRYSCQNEENWDTAECSLPMCRINDKCTTDLVGSLP